MPAIVSRNTIARTPVRILFISMPPFDGMNRFATSPVQWLRKNVNKASKKNQTYGLSGGNHPEDVKK
jgi:hypothetical protein